MIKSLVKNRYSFFLFRNIIKLLLISIRCKDLEKFYHKLSYLRMKELYRKKNVHIGLGTILYDVRVSSSFKGDRFYIGKNCCLTGCTLLGHDASPGTFLPELVNKRDVYLPGSRKSYRANIIIGDNVFIGTGAIVLPGINIGNNVVIGAGSVVTKNISNNTLVAGNPAKIIGNIDDFKTKYKSLFKKFPERF